MKMVTTCPSCGTSFRIHKDQIDARGGQVRCGHCTVVFDAHMHLQMEPELPPPMEMEEAEDQDAVEAPQESEPAPSEPPDTLPPPENISAEMRTDADPDADLDDDDKDIPTLEELGFGKKRRRGGWLWFVGACLAFLLLAGQLLYYFRSDAVVYVPSLRPLLEAACEQFDCSIPLPRHADMVSIESDEMEFNREKSEIIKLSAILRNRAPFDQAYPAIELTLTDEAQKTLTRRILLPAEYLDEAQQKTGAFAANSELAVKLHIDSAGLNPSGYRMEISYPPLSEP